MVWHPCKDIQIILKGAIALQHDINNATIRIAENNLLPMFKASPNKAIPLSDCLASQVILHNHLQQ